MKLGKNLFITFEGPEGAGKTTQVALLKNFIEENYQQEVVLTREPGGTEVAETLRNIVKYHQGDEPLTDETELLLFAASRSQHVNHLIIPSLKSGKTVICDRYCDSTVAYQGYARKQDQNWIKQLNHYATNGVMPHITFLLDLPVEVGFERTHSRAEQEQKNDRLEAESKQFHTDVRDGFLSIAKENPTRVKVIDATQSIERMHEMIKKELINAFR
jgi:dTMP kinase